MNLYATILMEFLLTSLSILFLFRFRKRLGLAPLYILLGSVQYLQALSVTMVSFKVFGDVIIYPGSVIVFSAVLFAVLLIYIKEGVASARALIIGIIISNFILSALFGITYVHEQAAQIMNDVDSSSVFLINYKYFITGTLILLVDFILLVIIYQSLISKIGKRYFFLVLFISLFSVLIFDALAFNAILRYDAPDFKTSLISHLIGKSISALVFSAVLYSYLKFIDNEKNNATFIADQNRDTFSIVKYKKKYEDLKVEKTQVEKKLVSQIESTLDHISDGFVSLDTNWRYTYVNKKAAGFIGLSPENLIGKNIWAEFPEGVGSKFYTIYHKAFETQETIYFEEYYEPLDKWFENRVYPSSEGITVYFTDITDQKKADMSLKESENHLRTILESEPECIKQLNAKGELIYMNPAGLAMIEADNLAMVKGKSVINLISPEYQFAFNKLTKKIFNGISGILEFEIIGIKGTKRWLETHAVPLKDDNGTIISLLAITRDITEQKKAHREIEEMQQKIEAAIRIGKIGHWSWDIKTDEVFWSDLMYEIYDVDKGTKLKYNTVLSRVHPDDRDFHNKLTTDRIKNKDNASFEYRVLWRDKTVKHVMVQMEVVQDEAANAIKFQGTVIDITERKEAEEKIKSSETYLENIINNIGDPVFVKDSKSRMILVNDALCSIFNMTRANIIGKTLAENVPKEERERFLSNDEQVILTGEENITEETLSLNKKDVRTISTKKTRFIDKAGNKFLIGVIRDITARKKAEKEILALGKRNTLIIETLLDGFLLADTTGKILDANPSYINMIGYTLDELLTMNINQLEVALNQTEIEERIEEMVREGFARFNSNHKKKNGEIVDLDVNTFTMQVNGQFVVAAFMKDITESIKVEIELEKHRNHLEELVKIRTEEVDLKNAELQRMNKLFVGRELRMKELKNIINEMQLKKNI